MYKRQAWGYLGQLQSRLLLLDIAVDACPQAGARMPLPADALEKKVWGGTTQRAPNPVWVCLRALHTTLQLKKKLRRVATIRNELIHNIDYNEIKDREKFMADVREASKELEALGRSRGAGASSCSVM